MFKTMEIDSDLTNCVQARLKSDTGEDTGGPLDLLLNITKDQLQLICNALLQEVSKINFKYYTYYLSMFNNYNLIS